MNQEFLNPQKVLSELELHENMIAADFGSGSGGWAMPLAKRLKEGKIYAIDILEEPLSALESRARAGKIFNIKTVLSNIENKGGSKLPDESCDLVLMTNLLFQCENKNLVLEEGKRVLKSGGKILIVDWKEDSPLGPEKGRISAKKVKETTKELGLKLKKEFKAGDYHYGLIFEKP